MSHMDQINEIIKCIVCFENFDNADHMPLILECGHTFCCRCILQVQKGLKSDNTKEDECPLCDNIWKEDRDDESESSKTTTTSTSTSTTAADFQIILDNDELKQAEQPKKFLICQFHNNQFIFWCDSCKAAACKDCVDDCHADCKLQTVKKAMGKIRSHIESVKETFKQSVQDEKLKVSKESQNLDLTLKYVTKMIKIAKRLKIRLEARKDLLVPFEKWISENEQTALDMLKQGISGVESGNVSEGILKELDVLDQLEEVTVPRDEELQELWNKFKKLQISFSSVVMTLTPRSPRIKINNEKDSVESEEEEDEEIDSDRPQYLRIPDQTEDSISTLTVESSVSSVSTATNTSLNMNNCVAIVKDGTVNVVSLSDASTMNPIPNTNEEFGDSSGVIVGEVSLSEDKFASKSMDSYLRELLTNLNCLAVVQDYTKNCSCEIFSGDFGVVKVILKYAIDDDAIPSDKVLVTLLAEFKEMADVVFESSVRCAAFTAFTYSEDVMNDAETASIGFQILRIIADMNDRNGNAIPKKSSDPAREYRVQENVVYFSIEKERQTAVILTLEDAANIAQNIASEYSVNASLKGKDLDDRLVDFILGEVSRLNGTRSFEGRARHERICGVVVSTPELSDSLEYIDIDSLFNSIPSEHTSESTGREDMPHFDI